MTYREAGEATGLSHACIGHIATGKRTANRKSAAALDKLVMPREVRTWVARETVKWLRSEIEWWQQWAQDDLKDEWLD